MKIAYFDCFSGISGDMILGALIDTGIEVEELTKSLAQLNVSGYQIKVSRVARGAITATHVEVLTGEEKAERNLNDIYDILEQSHLEGEIVQQCRQVFLNLARAEAKVHNKGIEEIHFHEVGALDTIVDVAGSLIGLKKLGVGKVYASPLRVGSGSVKCRHGELPLPAPATLELLKGVPIYSTGTSAELVTPTGAAILTTLCDRFGPFPTLRLEKVGYGAGSRQLNFPNVLRLSIGEISLEYDEDLILILETDIDDMNPELYDYLSSQLLEKGALDVSLIPTQMKKNRPGIRLSVLGPLQKQERLLEIIFRETTTLGVRISEVRRKKLRRQIKTVDTSLGKVRVKEIFRGDKRTALTPEYEDCSKIAREKNLPLRIVYQTVQEEAEKKLRGRDGL